MSDDGFLKRWSRKKKEPEGAKPEPARDSAASPDPKASEPNAPAPATPEEEAVDPATLPPIESLGPDSDYTVFLKKGVPEALKLAALRKAWMSDAFIRDFRSPAIEYGWDFTTPEYSLRPSDNVAKMLDQMFPPKPAGETPADPPPPAEKPAEVAPRVKAPPADSKLPQKQAVASLPPASTEKALAATDKTPAEPVSRRRKHGGAMPD